MHAMSARSPLLPLCLLIPIATTQTPPLPDNWRDILVHQESAPIPPELVACTDLTVPRWLREAAEGQPDNRDFLEDSESRGPRKCKSRGALADNGGLMMPEPPTYESQAWPVPRISAAALSSREFFWRFARTGLPVVVTDGWEADRAWWEAKADGLVKCAAAEYQQLSDKYGGVSPPDCDIYTNWCKDTVQVVRSGECATFATVDDEHMPPALRFDPPLNFSAGETQHPYVLSAREGMSFGNPAHYDNACMGSISVQYVGRKVWNFWAPWDLPAGEAGERAIHAHQRFETEVGPGDFVIYGPAWFHSTRIVKGFGDSIAAAYYTGPIPFFGAMRNVSRLDLSPLGFGACTGSSTVHPKRDQKANWFGRSAVWESFLQPEMPPYLPEGDGVEVPMMRRLAETTMQHPSSTIPTPTVPGAREKPPPKKLKNCEEFCKDTPCSELTGDTKTIQKECGGCPSNYMCDSSWASLPRLDKKKRRRKDEL